jgi:hypothetical protein
MGLNAALVREEELDAWVNAVATSVAATSH